LPGLALNLYFSTRNPFCKQFAEAVSDPDGLKVVSNLV